MIDRVARIIEAKSGYMISAHFARTLSRAVLEGILEPTEAMPENDDID